MGSDGVVHKDVTELVEVRPFPASGSARYFTLSFFEGRFGVTLNEKIAIGCDVWEASTFLTSHFLWRTTFNEQSSSDSEQTSHRNGIHRCNNCKGKRTEMTVVGRTTVTRMESTNDNEQKNKSSNIGTTANGRRRTTQVVRNEVDSCPERPF